LQVEMINEFKKIVSKRETVIKISRVQYKINNEQRKKSLNIFKTQFFKIYRTKYI